MSQLAKCNWCGKQIRRTVINPGTKAERVIWSHDFQAPAIPCMLTDEKHDAKPVSEPESGEQSK